MTEQKRFLVRLDAVHQITYTDTRYTFSFVHSITDSNDNRYVSSNCERDFCIITTKPMPWKQGQMYYLYVTDLEDIRPYEEL